MKIKVDEINRKAIISIDPKDYFLVETKDDQFPYGLAIRIDMSYSGKPDQWTIPVILFGEKEAEKLRGIIDEVI